MIYLLYYSHENINVNVVTYICRQETVFFIMKNLYFFEKAKVCMQKFQIKTQFVIDETYKLQNNSFSLGVR